MAHAFRRSPLFRRGSFLRMFIGPIPEEPLICNPAGCPLCRNFFPLDSQDGFLNNYMKQSFEGHSRARELFEQAIELDPNYIDPYILLAHTCSEEARYGFSKSPEKSMEQALNFAQKAIELDKSSSGAHTAMGRVLKNLMERVSHAPAILIQIFNITQNCFYRTL